MVVSVGSKEGGDLGGRVGALRLPPRLLRAALACCVAQGGWVLGVSGSGARQKV